MDIIVPGRICIIFDGDFLKAQLVMIRFLLAVIIMSTAAKFIHTYCSAGCSYEIARSLLQGEEGQEEKCENGKTKFDHGDNLYFVVIKAFGILAFFARPAKHSHSTGFYVGLFRKPNTPPPDPPAI